MGLLPRRKSSFIFIAFWVLLTLWYLSSLTELYAPPSLSNVVQPGTSKLDDGGRFHWKKPKEHYPVESIRPLPTGPPKTIPRIQHVFRPESEEERLVREERLAGVKRSFLHSWEGYKNYAWLEDELSPISGGNQSTFAGWAATLVDSLDTLWIMGLEEEFEHAVGAVAQIDFTTSDADTLNVFETTIRYLGGLLGAYDLSNAEYPILLRKATELGEILYFSFETPNRMPITRWKWKEAASNKQAASEMALIAEIGSLSLEFTRLSQLTGNPKYYDAVARITDALERSQDYTRIPGLWPIVVNANQLTFKSNIFSVSAMADSLYEYLPKQHLLLGGVGNQYRKLYEFALEAAKKHLFFRPMSPGDKDILIPGIARYDEAAHAIRLDPQMQHLGCFAGGMVALAAKTFNLEDDLPVARKLVDGCIWAYDSQVTGIMPEISQLTSCEDPSSCPWDEAKWHDAILSTRRETEEDVKRFSKAQRAQFVIQQERLQPGYTGLGDFSYKLRPEAIESIFVLYRITGDRKLQDAAWRMFEAIERNTRTEIANAMLIDVTSEVPEKRDRMESFWLAETLKYFYLIFSPADVVSLDDWVL